MSVKCRIIMLCYVTMLCLEISHFYRVKKTIMKCAIRSHKIWKALYSNNYTVLTRCRYYRSLEDGKPVSGIPDDEGDVMIKKKGDKKNLYPATSRRVIYKILLRPRRRRHKYSSLDTYLYLLQIPLNNVV